ncbi:MAG TPA: bifunctional glutamate N-acetyltransferase/amino-acid acetyltransferase ArgJ [Polyangiaceae bacterium]|nr:bifunctional glutamate N-acetyltransferase/amino-acid acetyltransferase ArgJ [Polyangiaceae bacterium]
MTSTIAGFRFAAVSAGIRKDGRVDVALAVADRPAVVAGLFTRNLVRAAPVLVAEERVRSGLARAILVNAGCANACTGEPGLAATREATESIARALGIPVEEVLPASTGVIGALLPAAKIASKAKELAKSITPEGHADFAQAICTTDRWVKVAEAKIETSKGDPVSVLGIAKGAGMIHPDVGPPQATMLVFLFTDAVIKQEELQNALGQAADKTFNACSVDGDTSTNDTVIALASGASNIRLTAAEIAPALTTICDKLARSMIADGEGANHCVEIRATGLANEADAKRVAQTMATSLLVKTALHGKDANWGRLLAAAGRAGVAFDPKLASIKIGDIEIVKNGLAIGADAEKAASEILKGPSYKIEIGLGAGPGAFSYLTSDLGHGYVDVNADYRS